MDDHSFSDLPASLAHKHSFENELELMQSDKCGCFYCLKIFTPDELNEDDWIEDGGGRTAECPFCGTDSVIGDASGYPITKEFLAEMEDLWFGQIRQINK